MILVVRIYMKLFNHFFIFLFVCSLCSFSSLFAQTVQTEGEGLTKDDAIHSALRLAVEQVGGVELSSSTLTRDFLVVKDVILAEAKGFVSNFSILDHRLYKDGVHWVRVQATVQKSQIPGRVNEIRGLLVQKGYPTFLLDIPEYVNGKETGSHRILENALKNLLLQKSSRMQITNFHSLSMNHQRAVQDARNRNDTSALHQATQKLGYDIVIRGSAKVEQVGKTRRVYGIEKRTFRTSIVADAIRAESGTHITSSRLMRRKEHRKYSATTIRQNLMDEAAQMFSQQLLGEIIRSWIDDINRFQHISLRLSGIQFDDLDLIEDAFGAIPTIQGFQEKGFDSGTVEYQIQLKGKTSKLARFLHKLPLSAGKTSKNSKC